MAQSRIGSSEASVDGSASIPTAICDIVAAVCCCVLSGLTHIFCPLPMLEDARMKSSRSTTLGRQALGGLGNSDSSAFSQTKCAVSLVTNERSLDVARCPVYCDTSKGQISGSRHNICSLELLVVRCGASRICRGAYAFNSS